MQTVRVSNTGYRLLTERRGGQWVARAVRTEDGERFGAECAAATEAEAVALMTRWLEWQAEHTAALTALQQAEHAYHRAIAGSAFANPTEGPSALEIQKESLDVVEVARTRLDAIRARRPA